MICNDPLYGIFEIPASLAEIVNSKAFQRLKRLHQGGAIYLIDRRINHTRFEHSLGVMYLVRFFGGSTIEQIAALLHDISHTAFSHVVDKVFDKPGEDYHEEILASVVGRSDIPAILHRQGYSENMIFNEDHTLLEQPYPFLCADRLDYTLRDLFTAGLLERREALDYLGQLTVTGGRITYKSAAAENWFKNKFQILNEEYFRKPEYLYVNDGFAAILKYALKKGILTENDLLTDDHTVIEMLKDNISCDSKLNDLQSLKDFSEFNHTKVAAELKKRAI